MPIKYLLSNSLTRVYEVWNSPKVHLQIYILNIPKIDSFMKAYLSFEY